MEIMIVFKISLLAYNFCEHGNSYNLMAIPEQKACICSNHILLATGNIRMSGRQELKLFLHYVTSE